MFINFSPFSLTIKIDVQIYYYHYSYQTFNLHHLTPHPYPKSNPFSDLFPLLPRNFNILKNLKPTKKKKKKEEKNPNHRRLPSSLSLNRSPFSRYSKYTYSSRSDHIEISILPCVLPLGWPGCGIPG